MQNLFGIMKKKNMVPLKIRAITRKFLNSEIMSETGLTEIGKFDEQDIFIAGYPKSGNTWFQNIICQTVYGLDTLIAPDTLVQTMMVDIHLKRYYYRLGTPMYFKTHHLPRPEYRRVIYLLRDGRDAMVSYFHHIKAIKHLQELDYIDVISNGTYLFPCKWHVHVEQWLNNPYNAQMMIIHYEEMKAKPLDTIRRFCEFVGINRTDSYLEQVIQKTSFTEMKKKELSMGWDSMAWPKDQPFIRRGEVGSFKDEMSPDILNLFLRDAGDTLRRVGYSTD